MLPCSWRIVDTGSINEDVAFDDHPPKLGQRHKASRVVPVRDHEQGRLDVATLLRRRQRESDGVVKRGVS